MLTLAYGRSGQVIWCPHHGEAVPSASLTCAIYDESGNTMVTTTTATKGSLSTTLLAAITPGDRVASLSTISGVSKDDYVAFVGDDQRTEVCKAIGVDTTAKRLTLDRPLEESYSVGDEVKSASLYYTLDASATATWTKGLYYQAIFSCSSWTEVRSLVFRIADKAAGNPITYEDIQRVLPSVGVYRGADNLPQLDRPRDLAWQIISTAILAKGRDPQTLRDPSRFAVAGGILAAAFVMLDRPGGIELAQALAGDPIGTGGIYRVQLDQVLDIPHWYDRDQDAIREAGETGSIARTRVRRGR